MTRLIGHSALLVALFVAALGVVLAPIGVKRARQDLVRAMYSATYAMFALVTAATFGCCLGFLPHNFNPARLFMGDSGALLLGLLLAAATISLTGSVDPSSVSGDQLTAALLPILAPLAVLSLPFLDMLLAVLRRTRAAA